ncbi:uncharacterized protein LOC101171480 isoform X2 [Oryzias latipes]|uniref:uncharacterized protein LOC101171480 isoform X2 n=1 Tax=Oryzias latipes TaxID=8090 RepID=UPI0005CC8829|nr:uncharacterized protein LOC101171480 isoform X2 [Oryzias latipes]
MRRRTPRPAASERPFRFTGYDLQYTRLQSHDGGVELDMKNSSHGRIYNHIVDASQELSRLESENMADQSSDSFSSSDTTGEPLQSMCKNETFGSTSWLAVENSDASGSSLKSGWSSFSQMDPQPEDEDETLQMSLSSHGCSLGQVYPSMVRRIERAWHTQNVSQAADTVLRKYRRWRQQPPRSVLNNTFDVSSSDDSQNHRSRRPLFPKGSSTLSNLQNGSSAQTLSGLREGQAHLPSPVRREKPPILVMDFSEPSAPVDVSLNETFIVLSPAKPAPVSTYSFRHSQPCSPAPKSPLHPSSLKKPSFSLRSSQMAPFLPFPVETRAEVCSSPVRQSPLKDRKTNFRSSFSFSRNPEDSIESARPSFLSSPLKRPDVPPRRLYPEDPHQPQTYSPRSSGPKDGRRQFRRHLSFDSSQPRAASDSPQKIDEDFLKLYHKFVCQNKMASSHAPPCRLCVRSSVASRCRSSLALAALALSPHRPIFRKRHWELGCDTSPQSKRLREESCTLSPGSKHHRREMLRRWPVPSPQELLSRAPYTPSKRGPSQSRAFSAANSPVKLFY